MSYRSIARLVALVPFAALLAAACDSSSNGPFPPPGPLAIITVSPNPVTLSINGTQQYTAVGTDSAGNIVSISPTWSVVAAGGGISSAGLFTAAGVPGTFANTVRATSGSISGNATVNVTTGPAATITVTPTPVTLATSATQQFAAVVKDAAGNILSISPNWSVAAGGGTINPGTGLFTAGTVAGTYTNTATASVGSINGSATVTVTAGSLATITVTPNPQGLAIGGTQLFTAVGRDANLNVVPITPTWSVVASGGTINSGSGLFTAGIVAGTFANTVRACSTALCAGGSISGFATVTVSSGVLATIIVAPNPVTLAINGTQQFTAVGTDASGNVVAITPTWSVVASGGAINSGSGLFTAGTVPGTFTNTVRATSGSIIGNATVNVTTGLLATITVTPNPDTLPINATQQFTAVGTDASGNVVAITPTWSVVESGGIITSGGLFTAGTVAGTFTNTVRACSTALCAGGSVSGVATVTVTSPGVLAAITVTPNPATVNTGGTKLFTASGLDANSVVIPISPAPTWSVVNGGGTINSISGLFTAGVVLGAFPNTIRATSGSISGFASVTTVTEPPPLADLGVAAPNGIMAGTAVTCITGGIINADVSVSPGNTITGFGPCVITGVQNLANAVAANGQNALTTAYNTLAGLPCPPANAIVANLGGTTKPAGVYCTASGIGVTGVLTLDGGGDPNANFVFQAGSDLITAGDIVLINGAQAKNVYWQVGTSATLGTASKWQGNVLALTSITLVDNASVCGRTLARNGAVSLGTNNTITLPGAVPCP